MRLSFTEGLSLYLSAAAQGLDVTLTPWSHLFEVLADESISGRFKI